MSQTPEYWPQAVGTLSRRDKVLRGFIKHYDGELMQGRGDAFHTLLRSITGQQISVKAADAVWGRLMALAPKLKAQAIAKLTEDELRACGYSRQKVSYIHSLCEFFLARKHLERDWALMEDEEIIKDLIHIKGIGRWTAEMFLIFHLLRPNVLPLDDLGLVNAMAKYYFHGQKPTKAQMREKAADWQPYCSVATWYLWRSLDGDVVSY